MVSPFEKLKKTYLTPLYSSPTLFVLCNMAPTYCKNPQRSSIALSNSDKLSAPNGATDKGNDNVVPSKVG